MPPMPPMPPGGIPARALGLRPVADHCLGGDQQPRNRGGILQRYPAPPWSESMIPATTMSLYSPELCVEAEIRIVLVGQLADDDRALNSGILGDLPHRRLDGLADDLDADLLVVIGWIEAGEDFARKEQRNTAARRRCLPRPRPWSRASRRRRGPCAPSPRPRCRRQPG